jgi:similar to stage IV sporulation protein
VAVMGYPALVKGKVRLACTGERVTGLINQTVQAGIHLEDIQWVHEQKLHLTVPLTHFFSFVSIARRNKVRLKIVKKEGVPFFMRKLKRRKAFLLGVALFILLTLSLSSFVWRVQIEGNEQIPERYVQALLKKEGVFVGQLKGKLPEAEVIQHDLLMHLPKASWVGFRVEGTRVIVTIVEKKEPETKKEENRDPGPVNLVAKKNAMVYDLRVERGNPLVEVNQVVKKGQILVSGIYGDPENPDHGKIVGAKGKVIGEVWYESNVSVPLVQKRKVYTGERVKKLSPYLFSMIIPNPFAEKVPFKKVETIRKIHSCYLGKWRLPFGLVEDEILEMKWVKKDLTPEDAVMLGKMRAREELQQRLGRNGRILEEKILHQRVENGKVNLKVHFDAIENIASIQPILQGE